MDNKLFDSELRILEILWEGGEMSAKDVAARAAEADAPVKAAPGPWASSTSLPRSPPTSRTG